MSRTPLHLSGPVDASRHYSSTKLDWRVSGGRSSVNYGITTADDANRSVFAAPSCYEAESEPFIKLLLNQCVQAASRHTSAGSLN